MDNLPYLVGLVADFEECGIPTEGLRKSIDGTKAVIHLQTIETDALTALMNRENMSTYSHEETLTLMETAEWTE